MNARLPIFLQDRDVTWKGTTIMVSSSEHSHTKLGSAAQNHNMYVLSADIGYESTGELLPFLWLPVSVAILHTDTTAHFSKCSWNRKPKGKTLRNMLKFSKWFCLLLAGVILPRTLLLNASNWSVRVLQLITSSLSLIWRCSSGSELCCCP